MVNFREPRRQVRLVAQLRCGEDWCRIAITNVSTAGLRCECPDPPALGESVEVRYQGFSIIGSVQWCEDDEFGVTCDDMVDVELLVAGSPEVDIGRRALPRLEVRFPAEFVVGDQSFPVVVHDISPSGARLSMASPPPRGKQGLIKWEDIESACTVVWSGTNLFGVIFGDELPAEPETAAMPDAAEATAGLALETEADGAVPAAKKESDDRRGTDRVGVNWTCEARHADSRWVRVQLSNISKSGCVIGWFAGCRVDVALYLKMPGLSTVKAKVVWKNDRRIGCQFSAPLNEYVLEHLLSDQPA
ncbi:MAG: PilZ domain-containing protein [Novosphingobium sp.]|nr:PilZ domain-containing protein [Novosphingobium sp.]